MNSKAYREFDVDFILKCCKNYLEYLERKEKMKLKKKFKNL